MSSDDKQRMIHIRINSGTHKELRKVAAEYDLTIQEIVSEAVVERVDVFEDHVRLEKDRERLERERERLEQDRERLERERETLESQRIDIFETGIDQEKLEPVQIEIEHKVDTDLLNAGPAASFHQSVLERFEVIETKLDTLADLLSEIHRLVDTDV